MVSWDDREPLFCPRIAEQLPVPNRNLFRALVLDDAAIDALDRVRRLRKACNCQACRRREAAGVGLAHDLAHSLPPGLQEFTGVVLLALASYADVRPGRGWRRWRDRPLADVVDTLARAADELTSADRAQSSAAVLGPDLS